MAPDPSVSDVSSVTDVPEPAHVTRKPRKKRGPVSAVGRENIRQACFTRPPISEETRRKKSESGKGQKRAQFYTPEVRERMSQAALNRPPPSWLWTDRKPVSEETRAKLSAAGKLRPPPPPPKSHETREKLRQAKLKNPTRYWLGKKRGEMSAEVKAKISAANSGRPKPAGFGQRIREIRLGVSRAKTLAMKASDELINGIQPFCDRSKLHGDKRFRSVFVRYKGKNFRSGWEVRVVKAMDRLGLRWKYEPKRFDLGDCEYVPDFYLPDEGVYWEVKGYFDERSRRKVAAFRERYPHLPLVVIDEQVMLALEIAAVAA